MPTLLDATHDMWDDITPTNIPTSAYAVAGYVDGNFNWTTPTNNGWTRFPNSLKLGISAIGTNAGICCDVEAGDLTPASAVNWVAMRRRSGIQYPGVYCSLSAWDSVIQAFVGSGVPIPWFWIAHYDNTRDLPTISIGGVTYQAVAKQYNSFPDHDISCISDTLVSILGGTVSNPLQSNDPNLLAAQDRTDAMFEDKPTSDWSGDPAHGQENKLHTHLVAQDTQLATILVLARELQTATSSLSAAVTQLQASVAALTKPSGTGTVSGTITFG